MKDWRLTNQIDYLSGIELKYRALAAKNSDHDHCAFCWEKFYNGDFGYQDKDSRHIVCEQCYNDFKEMFGWK